MYCFKRTYTYNTKIKNINTYSYLLLLIYGFTIDARTRMRVDIQAYVSEVSFFQNNENSNETTKYQ